MSKKIQLVRPPLDDWYTVDQINDLVSIPIGLCLLSGGFGNVDVDIQIIDGMNKPLKETLDRLDGDIVGVTDMYSSHRNALKILEKVKSEGGTTVIGGPNVNHIGNRIVRNNEYVDFAVIGDGEEAFPLIVSGIDPRTVPNLVYMKNGAPVINRGRSVPLTTLYDLKGVDTNDIDVSKPISLSSIRGCIKAEKGGRCSFCSMDHELKVMDPDLVWKQIRSLYEEHGFQSFLETGDSFFVGNYPKRLLESRPTDLSRLSFGRVYVSPDQINEENAMLLRSLNTEYVFMGIETIDDDILRCANKSYTKEDIERAIKTLDKHGIMLHVPFMYGLEGETLESMEKNYAFAERMVNKNPSIRLCVSFAIPLPGSKLFHNLQTNTDASKEYDGDLDDDDSFNYQKLVELHLRYRTNVNYKTTMEYVNRTKGLISTRGDATSFHIND